MSLATLPTQPTDHPAIRAAKRVRNRTAKATSRPTDKPRKLSFYLSPEASKRLGIAAVMEGESQSAIVERLVMESLKRWVVSDRGGKSDDQVSPAMVEGSAN